MGTTPRRDDPVMPNSATSSPGQAWLVVAAGGVAALQVGKLPPALPALQVELSLTLVQSGFLLSMVQLAGMSLAVFLGLWADATGLKRSMVRGLCLLALASTLVPLGRTGPSAAGTAPPSGAPSVRGGSLMMRPRSGH